MEKSPIIHESSLLPTKFLSILLLIFIFLTLTIGGSFGYYAVKTQVAGLSIKKDLTNKDKQIQALQKQVDALKAQIANASVTPTAAPTQQSTASSPTKKTTTTTSTQPLGCTYFNIREGEFASNKCYTTKDYDDLVYYIDRFNAAVFTYNGAISSMRITCNGSDFFKNQCEQDKQEQSQGDSDMQKYRGMINAIIARGK